MDDLRAFSFFLVFFYHSGYLEAGYVGVDLFFILSGYLMTMSIISIRAEQGKKGILTFLQKRTARLLPSILVLTACTCFISYLVVSDNERAEVLRSALTVLTISTNYYHALSQDYFGLSSFLNPFTHMWSISAEIHFYLVIAILGFFFRFRVFAWVVIIGFFLAISAFVGGDSSQTYLYSHTRIFSFLAGSMVFFASSYHVSIPNNNKIRFVLYVLIFLSATVKFSSYFIGIDWLANSLFANVLGIALLYLTLNKNQDSQKTEMNMLLLPRVWTYLGRISYSLYLVHFPVISFYYWTRGQIGPIDLLVIFAATVALAMLNYRFIESKYFSWSSSGSRLKLA